MEQQQVPNLGPQREPERVREAAVSPPEVRGVLRVGVLAVVDQERSAAREPKPGDPLAGGRLERLPERRLVVREVAEGRAAVADPVAQRVTAVIDETGLDRRRAEPPRAPAAAPEA